MKSQPKLLHQGVLRRVPLQPHDLIAPITATKDLFTLAHLGVPLLTEEEWSLEIDGLVDQPTRITMAALRALPKKIIEAVHECAGNPLQPHVPQRRVVNVRWGGVPLREILRIARADPRAGYLWSYGADQGEFEGSTCPAYVKDLPLDRVKTEDVLLAYEVNGDPLPPENGHPVRLVVPGFYGTNSVKWLFRMILADRRADSPFTTKFYNDDVGGASSPVWAVAPESVIVQPSNSDILEQGSRVVIWGWAWGHDPVASVEVSVDGGTSWTTARISGRTDHGWHRFEIEWQPNSAGPAVLCSRATDCKNRSQPPAGARNAVHYVPVTLRNVPGSN